MRLPPGHGYCVPITSVMVMRPDFHQTHARAVARFAGTLVGVALATAVVQPAHPDAYLSGGLSVVSAALTYLLMRTGYAAPQVFTAALSSFCSGWAARKRKKRNPGGNATRARPRRRRTKAQHRPFLAVLLSRETLNPPREGRRCPSRGGWRHCRLEGRPRAGQAATMTFVDRVAAWCDEWAKEGRRIAGRPRVTVVAGTLLGLLAVAESVTEFVRDHGSIPRMAAEASMAGSGSGSGSVVGVQFVLLVGLLCLLTALPLSLLRPVAAGITVSVASVWSLTLFQTVTWAGFAAQLIAGYRLGRYGSQLLAVVLGLPFLVFALAGPADSEFRVRTVLLASLAPVAVLAGLTQRARKQALENSATRQVMAGTLMENTAREERARIAHELHDVVAHHISMVAVQAETARLATAGMPPEGAKRLLAIGDTARAALTEMRRLLGVLREDTQSGTGAGTADRRPQPGLRQLNDLLDEARDASGSAARLIVRGFPRELDPGVELAAYRIVQESLTNARRHASGAAIDVELNYTYDALRLCIRDNGPGLSPAAPAGGHGLRGMRERAAAVGGEFRTGSAVGSGFVIEASFPAKTEESL
ncbi:histidine kinase [Streptomyces sp. NBC_01210]|uniref:histidine kinase n=1 Tax=Streptomyces sp. NBC_01210 TaxID=2903774 RepID=UPI002E1102E4|nr:histidine kinase [Streptomyces sp. NBC_01210]